MSTTHFGRAARQVGSDVPHPHVRRGRERRDEQSRSVLVRRILSEFREMPCLRLTPDQAQRLFGLRADITERIIDTLIRQGQLRVDGDGRYAATEAG